MDTMHLLYHTPENISVEEIDQFIKNALNTKKYHLIWVTSYKEDATIYSDEEGFEKALKHVDEWDFAKYRVLPISDLGDVGILVACTE